MPFQISVAVKITKTKVMFSQEMVKGKYCGGLWNLRYAETPSEK